MKWVAANPDTDLAAKILALPPSAMKHIRLKNVGKGLRVRTCILCGCHSNSSDPVLGDEVLVTWGHLEDDGVTVVGLLDFCCVGVMRRRWIGWKTAELERHFKAEETGQPKHPEWRSSDLEFIKKNGFNESITQHRLDGGADHTKRSVKSRHNMQETFHLGQDALWPREAFLSEFGQEPETAGHKVISYPTPTGTSISGVRLPHKKGDKVPSGVIIIDKDFSVEVGMSNKIKKQEADTDGQQLQSAMQALSKRHMDLSSETPRAIPVHVLREQAKAKASASAAQASTPGEQSGEGAGEDEIGLHDEPGSIFDNAGAADQAGTCGRGRQAPAPPTAGRQEAPPTAGRQEAPPTAGAAAPKRRAPFSLSH